MKAHEKYLRSLRLANASRSSTKKQPDGWRYEKTVAEVEQIVSQIESGELELEEVFDQFAKAVEYLQQCESFLAERQTKIDLLIETLSSPPSS
jgi:exodeoxyribonuclease VII small subunit